MYCAGERAPTRDRCFVTRRRRRLVHVCSSSPIVPLQCVCGLLTVLAYKKNGERGIV